MPLTKPSVRWPRLPSGILPLLAIIASLALAGCSMMRGKPEPEFALIYNKAAQHHGPDRNPVIAIPGILGSKLFDPISGTRVWGAFEPGAADPGDPDGARDAGFSI